ncbi:hypothetical protein AK812_SmicGene20007 [Symbiodinium microadriaticum]|uniref:Uncharacterized protein n=1 Tax=Symbiodinium microadriaticum TaxID=2951 RepID=A0A1Q9DR16_SYMMI|nr:hypothetical protein AK812_SmicGene20007 [Symbiodinium microadriaticum]
MRLAGRLLMRSWPPLGRPWRSCCRRRMLKRLMPDCWNFNPGSWALSFVKAPSRGALEDRVPSYSSSHVATRPTACEDPRAAQRASLVATQVMLAVGLGMSKSLARSGPLEGPKRAAASSRKALPEVDWGGSATGWQSIRQKSILEVDWLNIHGVLTVSAVTLFLAQISRILAHQAPTELEVWLTALVYLPWIYFCFRDTEQLENHYAVTFYASCGWAVMSLASLFSVFYQDKFPELAFDILAFGNVVFAGACIYFYSYHWSRMWRHFTQNRFRPLWIPGLLGLMLLHSLTPLDMFKRLDDPGWWKTVCSVYSDEWWWVADVRIIELFVTAAALLLIILHIQGVFTGMKNAAVVVIGTIFAPLGLMVLESTWIRASSWQHYLMVGPKYW